MSNIVSIILILTSIGVFFGYVDPTYRHIKDLQKEKAQYDVALDNSKALQTERDKFLEKFNSMDKNDLSRLTKVLPDNIDNVRLIIDMDELAKKFGMRIRNFRADSTSQSSTVGGDTSPYGVLTLSFNTTAAYTTFLAFVRDMEHSMRILDIQAVSFAASDSNTLYDYAVTVKTYWIK